MSVRTVSRLGQRRQVVIPKSLCEEMGIREGDFLEVTSSKGAVIIKLKKLVDADDVLTPEEEAMVRKGMERAGSGRDASESASGAVASSFFRDSRTG
jgi:AbrB family looped-hinge helix DNA binding protein